MITHNLGIVRKMADRVCVMNNGEIVEQSSTKELFVAPQHAYTKHLLAAEPKGSPPVLDVKAPVVLEAKDLRVWFPIKRGFLRQTVGHIKAVDGIDLAVREGQTLGVVGESGSGKTTLGLALLRLISSNGPIVYLGNRIDGFDSKRMRPLRRDMQIVFQDPYGSLSPRLSIGQIIEEGLLTQTPTPPPEERRNRVARALREVGLEPAMQDRYPHESPAASANASPSRARWCSSRDFSSSMSLHQRSTFRCKRRSWIYCETCKSGTGSLISSSATTSK